MQTNGYQAKTDFQLYAMLAMGHHNSGVWYHKNKNKAVGVWISGQKAYEWSELVSSKEMVNVLTQYASTHKDTYIDSKTAEALFKKVYNENTKDYASKPIVCWYPIKALYAYIKLCMLYTS